jgi:tetratricopeptide (TPR) repeat protein
MHTLAVTGANAIAHQNLGNALLAEGEVDEAVKHFQAALELAPDLLEWHNDLGSALGMQGRYAEAIDHFRVALRARESAETRQNLGWALEHAGRSDEALVEYESALRLEPDFAAAHGKLGALLAARGRLDEADMHLRRALDLEAGDIETLRSMAIVRTLQGRVEEGIASYRMILDRAPKDLDALNNIAWIRATHAEAAHRDGADAVRLAERARDAAAVENDVLCSTLAAAYAEVGRFDDAVRVVTRAVELARARGDERNASSFEIQLALYRAGRPFHQ